jgi:hypothetical protein
MKELKYKNQLESLKCELPGYTERTRIAFRWTFDDINHENNFLPRYLLKPNGDLTECVGWGLSFFDQKDKARKRLLTIANNRRFIFKKLGTHIAQGKLDNDDGISNNSNDDSHFTHFEYANVKLENKFTVIEEVQC